MDDRLIPLQEQHTTLRNTILGAALSILILVALLTPIVCSALSVPNLDVAAGLAVWGLITWSGLALVFWMEQIPSRILHCLLAGVITLVAESIFFFLVSVSAWATKPLVLFLSFWASFAAEYFVGLISDAIEWYVKMAVAKEQPRTQGNAQA
ncbi:uncharacterized protein PG986_004176 [Apiospora aurea]|uniref:MARVEL domain-containing protein n=1 Tax=Apiospora aurea TaxID=335848 RepID=A0ABR1QMA7_9PEZI